MAPVGLVLQAILVLLTAKEDEDVAAWITVELDERLIMPDADNSTTGDEGRTGIPPRRWPAIALSVARYAAAIRLSAPEDVTLPAEDRRDPASDSDGEMVCSVDNGGGAVTNAAAVDADAADADACGGGIAVDRNAADRLLESLSKL